MREISEGIVSIRAPAWGATIFPIMDLGLLFMFQSARPHGARPLGFKAFGYERFAVKNLRTTKYRIFSNVKERRIKHFGSEGFLAAYGSQRLFRQRVAPQGPLWVSRRDVPLCVSNLCPESRSGWNPFLDPFL